MRFIVIRSNAKEGVSAIERLVGENLNLPILKNVLIAADGNGVVFTATNLDASATYMVSGKVIEEGRITVPLALLANILTNIQSDRLNLETKENALHIKTDNYQATLQGISADEFPVTPKIKNAKECVEIKGAFLKEAVQQVVVASQFSDLRPELNSVLLDFSVDALKLAATDGFRLAEKTIPQNLFTSSYTEPFKILIPLKAAQEAVRMLKDEEMVKIFHDENQILFKTERAELTSRLTEGGFPDYHPLIPKKYTLEATLSRDELLNAIKLGGVFGQKTNEVKFAAHPAKKMVEISSADQALGENNYLLPAKLTGDAAELFFNWRYLADPLRVMKGNEVFLGFQGGDSPALIRAAGDASYFYILKPILKS